MCPDRPTTGHPGAPLQRGFGLPLALFMITVLAFLVVGMAQQQRASGQSVSLQLQSQRAFFAAESGAQLAVANVLNTGSCASFPTELDFTIGALKECKALLSCSATDPLTIPGSGGNQVFTLISSGECGAGNELASRTVEVRVR
jgi:MSHA biogenesis protein MshP